MFGYYCDVRRCDSIVNFRTLTLLPPLIRRVQGVCKNGICFSTYEGWRSSQRVHFRRSEIRLKLVPGKHALCMKWLQYSTKRNRQMSFKCGLHGCFFMNPLASAIWQRMIILRCNLQRSTACIYHWNRAELASCPCSCVRSTWMWLKSMKCCLV